MEEQVHDFGLGYKVVVEYLNVTVNVESKGPKLEDWDVNEGNKCITSS